MHCGAGVTDPRAHFCGSRARRPEYAVVRFYSQEECRQFLCKAAVCKIAGPADHALDVTKSAGKWKFAVIRNPLQTDMHSLRFAENLPRKITEGLQRRISA
jgi:hypothetical protein